MEYRVLGQLMVLHDGVELPLRAGRPRALLLWLLLARGDVLSAELLQDRLWADAEAPGNPQNALQTQVSYLRRVFAPTGEQPIQTRGSGYCLRFDPGDVDAFRFERLLGDARQVLGRGDPRALPQAAALLGEALTLWRGHPLVELSGSEDVVSEVARLEEMHLAALELRAEVTLGLGRTDHALAELRGLVADHPLRERLHELLMVALYRSGRQGEALQAYQHVRDILIDELGIEPGPGLVSMQQRVLSHDRSLGEPTSVLPAAAAPPSAPALGGAQVAGAAPQLPAEVTTMVGRDEDVAAVTELLATHRVLTLTGPGGVGKTRVALAVARQTPQPVWFVDLTPVDSADKVATAVATVLGVTTRPDVHPADAITAETPRRGLLLLDTCERVVAGVADLVSRLLAAWPDVRVLATSRRPLHVAGELIRPVPPLPLPSSDVNSAEAAIAYPAVQLFLQRAAALRPDVDLARTALEVAALCRALDGLPLAIELAAAQIDVLGPAAIHRHLTERFELLVDESRGAEGRHRGLRTTIDWSVQLLTEEQRRFFARLAVFPASFDVAAAAAVTGHNQGRAIRLLAAVVRNSLVRPTGEDRFVLLDSLHDYAADLLDEDPDQADVAARHASFYAERAREAERHVRSPDQQVWWARLREDLANFRAAMQWSFSYGDGRLGAPMAASLTWVFIHDGMLDEADRWLRHAAKVDGLDASTRAQVLIHVAMLSSAIGRFQVALLTATEALELARTARDPVAAGAALSERGIAEWALGDLAASANTHDETIEVLSAAGEPWGAALAMLFRARTAIDAAEPQAADLAARALRAAQSTGDRALTGVALQQVALLALLGNDLDEAARAAAQSLLLVQALAYQEGIAGAIHLQGRVALARNDHAEAYRLFRQTLASGHRMGHVAIICQSLESIATALMAVGAVEQSGGLLELASRTREVRRMPARTIEAAWVQELQKQLDELSGGHRARTYLDVDDALSELPQSLPQRPAEARSRHTGPS